MSVTQPDYLKTLIDEYVPDLVATRRDFHEHPELAFQEVRTSGIVVRRLQALGLEVQTDIAQTGVVGLLRGGVAGSGTKTIALRADMDALPVHEQNDVDYRSQVDGKMHACGHDGHTAILLTVAEILSKQKETLEGNVKFLFQPAEEAGGGAKPMVDEGAMQDVDAVIALHLISDIQFGKIGVRSGALFASANDYIIHIKGKGGHAAMPQEAVDPIVISAHIITALQTLISRETSPFKPSIITIGELKAGTTFNIIPETALMKGTLRSFDNDHRLYLMRRIADLVGGVASALGGSAEVQWEDGWCPPCTNDPGITAFVRQAAIETVGEEWLDESMDIVTTGSDDMAEFLNTAPGCYFLVGSRNEAKGTHWQHHHPRFNIDEEALPIGVEVFVRTVQQYLNK